MLTTLAASTDAMPIIVCGMLFALVVLGWITWVSAADHKRKLERSRAKLHGEVMAYVAEGSISPDDAERLLKAMNEPDADVSALRDEVRIHATAAVGPSTG